MDLAKRGYDARMFPSLLLHRMMAFSALVSSTACVLPRALGALALLTVAAPAYSETWLGPGFPPGSHWVRGSPTKANGIAPWWFWWTWSWDLTNKTMVAVWPGETGFSENLLFHLSPVTKVASRFDDVARIAKAAGIGTDLSDEQWWEAYTPAFQTSTTRQAQPGRNCGIALGRPCD